MTTVKQSFEAMLKRRMVANPQLYQQHKSDNNNSQYFKQFKDTQFWPWDLDVDTHRKMYNIGTCRCRCFNCIIGWPKKNDVELPLFDYERTLLQAVERDKYILVKKATGLD
jgi:hypothetical protein